jgi:hypothetical protein
MTTTTTPCAGCHGPVTNPRRATRVGGYLMCENCWPTTVEGWERQREAARRQLIDSGHD